VTRRTWTRPEYNTESELLTFRDLFDHVVNAFDDDQFSAGDRAYRQAMQACRDAYRELASQHDWSYLNRRSQVRIEAPQTTGTIAYDHTGGTYERELTLSGATWPSDARYYKVEIDEEVYEIAERKSSTVVTLREDTNPGSDIAAGTSYKLFRQQYPAPADFRTGSQPWQLSERFWNPSYVHPHELQAWDSNAVISFDEPRVYTVRSADDAYAQMVFEFSPVSDQSRLFDYVYKAQPRPIKPFAQEPEYSDGSVAVSGTTVTGTGTAFSDRMIGCVIRFSDTDDAPSGLIGSNENYQPYAEQAIITAVASTTSLTIDAALSGTYSGNGYTISDPLDIEPIVMLEPLKILSEAKYARMIGHEDHKDRLAQYGMALRQAKAADSRVIDPFGRRKRGLQWWEGSHNLQLGEWT